MKNYTVMHCHSMLSNGITNIDSVTHFQQYVDKAKELGMTALGISEHGSTFEWWHKKCAIEKAGMKYIHEIEAYVTEALYVKETNDDGEIVEKKVRDNMHCVLIAANYQGFRELNKLISKSFNREDGHFYYAPRITLDELMTTSDNILISTACLGGILAKGNERVKSKFLDFCIKNKHRVFLEIQHHRDKEGKQKEYNQYLANISNKYNIKLIAGTDTHALNNLHLDGRKKLQESKGVHFADEDSWDLSFKTYDELVEAYEKQNSLPKEIYLQAIENTNVLASMIEEFTIDRNIKYPKLYDNPLETYKEKINKSYNKHKYIKQRYPKEQIKSVVNTELDVYNETKSIDFMLLQTYMREWEYSNGIECGYGRGSVSGSEIAYILGITQMDSIKFNLNFFRFMNPKRVTNADIDTDYSSKDREKVKTFLLRDHMNLPQIYSSEIITFNTIALKGAIRDIGRALHMSLSEVGSICDKCEDEEELIRLREKYPELFKYVDIVQGTIVSIGTHPSGVLVSDLDIEEELGLCTSSGSQYQISMLNMKELDDLMYVKLDILGLDNIGVINDTCKMLNIERLTPDNVDLDDMNVWNSMRDDTTLIFQWESNSAQAYLKRFMSDKTLEKVKSVVPNFSMIKWFSFGNGLIRPACASYREDVADGIFYDNKLKELNEFLAPTMGRVTMQEDIMQFLVKFCGYSQAESDTVRRGIAKKYGTEALLPEIEERFIEYSSSTYNISKDKCKEIIKPFLEVILSASSYAFSWNHSDSYSCIGYICGYLRYYYPLEFLTAALNIFEGKEDKTLSITEYARKVRIPILPIKFRHSTSDYTYDKKTNSIYKGIASIKFLNDKVADSLQEVKDKDYNNFIELLIDIKDMPINSKQLDILVKLNFFEEFGEINTLLKQVELFNNIYDKKQFKKDKLDELEIPLDIITKHSQKITEKLFKDFDSLAILNDIIVSYKYKTTTVSDKMSYELEFLGYIQTTIPSLSLDYAYVTNIDGKFKNKNVTLYRLQNGETEIVKVKAKTFEDNGLTVGDVIKTVECSREKKWGRTPEGEYYQKEEYETILKKWVFVR